LGFAWESAEARSSTRTAVARVYVFESQGKKSPANKPNWRMSRRAKFTNIKNLLTHPLPPRRQAKLVEASRHLTDEMKESTPSGDPLAVAAIGNVLRHNSA
jgi:hypothetical protein